MSSSGALYTRSGADYEPSPLCIGPWSEQTQNGAMVAGLLAQVLDGVETHRPMIPMDFHLEIFKPIPLRPFSISVHEPRRGDKLQVLRASLCDRGNELAHATLVRLRTLPSADDR